MFLGIKEIKYYKLRYAMIIMMIALIAYLVYFLSGLAIGLANANRSSVDSWDSSGVIMANFANDNINSSIFEENLYEDINYPNKAKLNLGYSIIQKVDTDKKINIALMGIEQESFLSPKIILGDKLNANNEIIITNKLVELYDLNLNDKIIDLKNNRQFKIVGITDDLQYNTLPVAYVNLEMASNVMMSYSKDDLEVDTISTMTSQMPNRISAIVIQDDITDIEIPNELKIITTKQFIDKIPGYQAQVLTFGLMIFFLILITTIIIAIFLYILTIQKKSLFQLLKVQGFSNRYIASSIVIQTFILTFIGMIIGLIMTYLTILVLPNKVPIMINAYFVFILTLITLLAALLGSLFSIKAIRKLAPLEII